MASFKDRVLGRSHLDEDEKKRKRNINDVYHGYFEGYEESVVDNEKGGLKLVRNYVGDYYNDCSAPAAAKKRRFIYAGLILISMATFGLSAYAQMKTPGITWYVEILQALGIAFLCWLLVRFFFYIPVRETMTEKQYKESSVSVKTAALLAGICMVCAAVSQFVFACAAGFSLMRILVFFGFILAGAAAFAVRKIESRVSYRLVNGIRSSERIAAEEEETDYFA